MTIQHWAILTIDQILTATGYKIVVTSDVPCHLYMRWSTHEPWFHHIPVLSRGIFLHTDIRICFTVFDDNQQEEAGDTLTHTFIKEPWPHCETRWFYFHGTITSNPTPSTSAIFKKHRYYEAPPYGPEQTLTFYPDPHPEVTSCDGLAERRVGYYGEPWPNLHDGSGTFGGATGAQNNIVLNAGANTNLWRCIVRAFFLFDTSIIPESSIIVQAKFRLKGWYKSASDPWGLTAMCVVPSNPALNTNITAPDYHNIGTTLLSDTTIYWADFHIEDWNEFPLNTAGLAAITPAGITKLGARIYPYDVQNYPPTWVRNKAASLQFYASEKGNGFKPELIVTYKPKL